MIKKRRFWLALLLGLILPGWGQFYNGRNKFAAIAAGVCLLGYGVFALLGGMENYTALWLYVGVVILQIIFALIAAYYAFRIKHIALNKYQTKTNYAFIIVFCVILSVAMTSFTADYLPFKIVGNSMLPSFVKDQRMIIKAYDKPIEYGDVVIFLTPDKERSYIKHVIGLPGDTVQYYNGELFINGEKTKRDLIDQNLQHAIFNETLPNGTSIKVQEQIKRNCENNKIERCFAMTSFDNTENFKVPDDNIFVLGSNRDNSLDSRSKGIGFVPIEKIQGYYLYSYFGHKDNE